MTRYKSGDFVRDINNKPHMILCVLSREIKRILEIDIDYVSLTYFKNGNKDIGILLDCEIAKIDHDMNHEKLKIEAKKHWRRT